MGVTAQVFDRVDWAKLKERGITTGADVIEEIADRAVEMAKSASPYDTGHNRDSITQKLSAWNYKGGKKGLAREVFTESGYGGYLELGTSRVPARPYIQPSVITAIKETLK